MREQQLGPVDVAHPRDHRLIEQGAADRDAAPLQGGERTLGVGVAAPGIRPEPPDDAGHLAVVEQLAGGGADQVDGALRADQPVADGVAGGRRG